MGVCRYQVVDSTYGVHMQPNNPSAGEWRAAYRRAPAPVSVAVSGLVDVHHGAIAAAFYQELLADPDTACRIPIELLNSRLLPSVQRWLQFLFDPANVTNPAPVIAMQRHVGELHVKAGITMVMVGQGFRCLKRALNTRLGQAPFDRSQLLHASIFVGELLDLAQAEMVQTQTQIQCHGQREFLLLPAESDGGVADINAVTAVPNNLEAERQQQLTALSDEENRFLQIALDSITEDDFGALASSPFGLWLNHKAPILFEEAAEIASLTRIAQVIDHLDTVVLPRLQASLGTNGRAEGLGSLLHQVVAGLEDIRNIVNSLFNRLASTDGYRDALTQLFNRPLLASMMRREMDLAKRKRSTFSILLVDIDHFSQINLAHGHEVGDRVLQHVATLLATQVRSSDFVFRYGGEEFLILLVELDEKQSMAVAEKIRCIVENAQLPLAGGRNVQLTLSLGVALYDGQTDPAHIIDLADQAVSRAKSDGRNRVCLAA